MNLSPTLQRAFTETSENLQSESATAQRRYLAFEGLINEFRYLQQQDAIIDAEHVAAVVQRPNINDPTLAASYPTPWTDLYLNAIADPSHFNVNHCLTVTAMQITDESGLPELQDVHLIPAIIRMFPTIHPDVENDTDSPVELTATIGRSGINAEHLPAWWPILLREATDIARNRVILNVDEPVEQNNVPIFHHDDLGRFLPTTRKAKDMNRALFLRALSKHNLFPIDPALDAKFASAVDQTSAAWTAHAINRFPSSWSPTTATTSPPPAPPSAPTKG